MIIKLDDSFDAVDLESNRIARDAVEAACGAAAKGHHYVFAGRSLLKKLSNSASLSVTSRGVCRELLAGYTFLASVVRKLKYVVEVSCGVEVVERRGATEWVIPARQIADHGIRPSILLAENSSDAEVYGHAARHFRLSEGMGSIEINIEPRNGNGAGTAGELRRISRRPSEWCLCITDSDLECPAGALGATSRGCGRVIEEEIRSVVAHVATAGRELENTIPSSLFGFVHEDLHRDEWEVYKLREVDCGPDALLFADLKLGTRLCKLMRMNENSPARVFWIGRAKNIGGFADCIKAETCPEVREDTCFLVSGFGESAASRIHEFLDSNSPHKSYEISKNSWNIGGWLDIGAHVFYAGAAPKPLRV
ncbi:hypothetical protein BLA18112_04194 [Burkholderia lata]|uniref:Uncharacterized protein n=1 Tax=Burkholderia lata (strain ATCC 17760 / DSM 23089 / LMG 22485 / NCIMB 9086 / R18194 / 383) TaxID=482957 RepID=A0A6P2X3C6_BURL3|nr:hypothetical protein [Burkholderia lata]VWD04061.1 hypothetical protein BLA18112_04194 [Burkholderia lata]